MSMVRKHSTCSHKRTHNFGFELPKMVNEAYAIDEKNWNTLWRNAIQKEMENVKIAWQIIPAGKKTPHGFQYVNCHIVFDIKMEDFHRQAYLVVGDYMTNAPGTITYSSVVKRETVHITTTIAASHDL